MIMRGGKANRKRNGCKCEKVDEVRGKNAINSYITSYDIV